MRAVNILSTSGRKLSTLTLPREIFGAKINQALMAQAVRAYLLNQREARAKTKRRGEIQASGRKIYRQKGTGRARHGDRKAPIFVKGAKAHGPTGEQNWYCRLNKKMKRKALCSALTSKLKENEIMVVSGLDKIEPKTKEMIKVIKNLKFKTNNSQLLQKATIILPEPWSNPIRAGRNLANLDLKQVSLLNTYEVLNAGYLIFAKESLDVLKKTFIKK